MLLITMLISLIKLSIVGKLFIETQPYPPNVRPHSHRSEHHKWTVPLHSSIKYSTNEREYDDHDHALDHQQLARSAPHSESLTNSIEEFADELPENSRSIGERSHGSPEHYKSERYIVPIPEQHGEYHESEHFESEPVPYGQHREFGQYREHRESKQHGRAFEQESEQYREHLESEHPESKHPESESQHYRLHHGSEKLGRAFESESEQYRDHLKLEHPESKHPEPESQHYRLHHESGQYRQHLESKQHGRAFEQESEQYREHLELEHPESKHPEPESQHYRLHHESEQQGRGFEPKSEEFRQHHESKQYREHYDPESEEYREHLVSEHPESKHPEPESQHYRLHHESEKLGRAFEPKSEEFREHLESEHTESEHPESESQHYRLHHEREEYGEHLESKHGRAFEPKIERFRQRHEYRELYEPESEEYGEHLELNQYGEHRKPKKLFRVRLTRTDQDLEQNREHHESKYRELYEPEPEQYVEHHELKQYGESFEGDQYREQHESPSHENRKTKHPYSLSLFRSKGENQNETLDQAFTKAKERLDKILKENPEIKKSTDWAFKQIDNIADGLKNLIPPEHHSLVLNLLDKLFFEIDKVFSRGEIHNNYYYYPNSGQPDANQPATRHGFLNKARDLVMARSMQVLAKALDLIKYGIQLLCENKLLEKMADRVKLKLVKEIACNTLLTIG